MTLAPKTALLLGERIVILLSLLVAPLGLAGAQEADSAAAERTLLLRLMAGSLNPSDPFATTIAWGVSAGIEWGGRRALLLRVVRQSHNRSFGFDLKQRARTFVTIDGEIARWSALAHEQQVRLRLGLGVLLRPGPDKTALVGSAGVAIRYQVAPHLSFIGQLEDDVVPLPRQEFQSCGTSVSPGGTPGYACKSTAAGGVWQHNFGLLVALEWRR